MLHIPGQSRTSAPHTATIFDSPWHFSIFLSRHNRCLVLVPVEQETLHWDQSLQLDHPSPSRGKGSINWSSPLGHGVHLHFLFRLPSVTWNLFLTMGNRVILCRTQSRDSFYGQLAMSIAIKNLTFFIEMRSYFSSLIRSQKYISGHALHLLHPWVMSQSYDSPWSSACCLRVLGVPQYQ